jgi:hypothetical protein
LAYGSYDRFCGFSPSVSALSLAGGFTGQFFRRIPVQSDMSDSGLADIQVTQLEIRFQGVTPTSE